MPKHEEKPLPVSSSRPPVFAPAQEELFRGVLQLMNQSSIPYVVSGAFALGQHTGIWRNTKDLDLFLAPHDIPPALHKLAEAGFETEVTDPVWLAKAHRGEFYVDLITGMSNAVITVDRSWIARSSAATILGVPTRVLAPEELIASKLFVTRRERFDGADIVHVIHGTQGKLDWNRVLNIVGEHWMIVLWAMVLFQYTYPAHCDYIPRAVWDDLLGRLGKELDHPNPRAHFRGSLIDEKMFAIDVHEWGMANLIEHHRRLRDAKPQPDKDPAEPAA
ncbi:MAG: nucleotidyltransferase [Acidobacteriaceae bacterium]